MTTTKTVLSGFFSGVFLAAVATALLFFASCSYAVTPEDLERVLPDVNAAIKRYENGPTLPVRIVSDLPSNEDSRYTDDRIAVANFVSDGNDLSSILIHEYGHAVGLGHSTDPYNVMYGGVGAIVTPIEGAMQLQEACKKTTCRHLGGLRIEK